MSAVLNPVTNGLRLYFGGGLNEQIAPDINEAAAGSYNFELSKDTYQLQPRKPFDLAGTTPNSQQITGIMQLVTTAGVETSLVVGGGKVYQWSGSSTFTAVGTCDTASLLRDTTWQLDNYLVITDISKRTAVSKWDGNSFGTLTTGLGNTLYAKYAIVHLGRMWLFNVKAGTDTPHMCVASVYENPTSYDTTKRAGAATLSTGLEAFYMLTPDLRPINGVCRTIAGDLIISTQEGVLYKLTGSSGVNFAWAPFYPGSQALGDESMIGTGNDVFYMKKGGAIESLAATQSYGDVASDDLSRWLRTTTKDLTGCITAYDQTKQKVYFFIAGSVLVFFKDLYYGDGALVGPTGGRAKLSPWSVYKTQYGSSPLASVQAVKYMRQPGTTTYTMYFGDNAGRVIDMNGVGASGDIGTTDVQAQRKTRFLDKRQGIDPNRHTIRGDIEYRRVKQCAVTLTLEYGDSYTSSDVGITLKGPASNSGVGYWGGSAYWTGTSYWSQAFAFANAVTHQTFSPVGRGSGVTLTISSNNNVGYLIDSVGFS